MAKIGKQNNILNIVKKRTILKLMKEKGIARVSPEALKFFDEKIFEDTENLIYKLKQNIQIKAKKTLEKEDILDLFENPLFLHSHKFSIDEKKTLFKWIEKANISWGLDEKHILKFLKGSDAAILKSFEKGLARIFLSAVLVLNQNFLDSSFSFDYPISELEISDMNVLDKFLKNLISVYNDLKIIEDKKTLTLDGWQKYLKNLRLYQHEH